MGKVQLRFEVDAEVAAKAARSGIDLADVARAAAEAAVASTGLSDEEKAKRWAEENAEAIAAHRRQIEEHGVFGDEFRTW